MVLGNGSSCETGGRKLRTVNELQRLAAHNGRVCILRHADEAVLVLCRYRLVIDGRRDRGVHARQRRRNVCVPVEM